MDSVLYARDNIEIGCHGIGAMAADRWIDSGFERHRQAMPQSMNEQLPRSLLPAGNAFSRCGVATNGDSAVFGDIITPADLARPSQCKGDDYDSTHEPHVIRLGVVTEGYSEREFVRVLLAPLLWSVGILALPVMVNQKADGRGLGGDVSFPNLVGAYVRESKNYDFVTSMVDFYGFRGKQQMRVAELEHALDEAVRAVLGVQAYKVIPYIQLHEFEALLFSLVFAFAIIKKVTPGMVCELRKILDRHGPPENINDHYSTCPSRRILAVFPDYDKVRHGILVAQEIGLEKMREECPRFDRWLKRLEGLRHRAKW